MWEILLLVLPCLYSKAPEVWVALSVVQLFGSLVKSRTHRNMLLHMYGIRMHLVMAMIVPLMSSVATRLTVRNGPLATSVRCHIVLNVLMQTHVTWLCG